MLLALLSVLLLAEPEEPGEAPERGRTLVPAAPSARLTPSERVTRLSLISDELRKLNAGPSSGDVFVNTMAKVLPYWLVGTAPLAAIGLAFGLGNNSLSVRDGDNGLLARSIGISLIIIGVTSAIALSLGLMSVIDHWFDEASEGPKRQARRDQLLEERARLEKTAPE